MANWSRALLSLGEGLGQLAQNVSQRERDAMLAMRDENLMRLNAQLQQQAGDREFGQRKELLSVEEGMTERAETRRQGFEVGQSEQRRQHEMTLQGRDEALRREQMRHETDLYDKRASREDLQGAERGYLTQMEAVDERLSKINDEMTKARAEASTAGTDLDPTLLQPWQDEIQQLQQQKRLIGKQRDIHLAQLGDPRYKKITPEEAAEEAKVSDAMQRSTPRENRAAGRPRGQSAPQMAAQAPAEVPQAPPKPRGMVEREQRKGVGRRVLDELFGENQADYKARTAERRAEAKQGARSVVEAVKGVIPKANAASLINESMMQLRTRGSVSDVNRAKLRELGIDGLKKHDLSDEQIARLLK